MNVTLNNTITYLYSDDLFTLSHYGHSVTGIISEFMNMTETLYFMYTDFVQFYFT